MTKTPPINWMNTLFLFLTPVGALVLIPLYATIVGFTLYEWFWFAVFMGATGISITAGYHRLWAHKAYHAHWTIRSFYAVFGACACQNSILKWASDHRVHHRFVDHGDKDPYAATRGFWHSHIGWVLRNYPRHVDKVNTNDLERDPIVRWQHRHYLALVLLTCFVIPMLLGMAVGRPFGVLLLAFLLRVVLNHHFTFFVNSLAHYWGHRPFNDENSSRDNMLLALVTYGEGFHNFHHAFQHDYRNGIRWWHFDPSKWMIRAFSVVGLTWDLKRANKVQIEKARLKIQLKQALAKLEHCGEGAELLPFLENNYKQFVAVLNQWTRVKKQWFRMKRAEFVARLEKMECRNRYLELKYTLKLQRRRWRLLMTELASL